MLGAFSKIANKIIFILAQYKSHCKFTEKINIYAFAKQTHFCTEKTLDFTNWRAVFFVSFLPEEDKTNSLSVSGVQQFSLNSIPLRLQKIPLQGIFFIF